MCPPDYFDVSYEINPWMHVEVAPNRDCARKQWDALYAILTRRLDIRVSTIAPQPGLPDMVFTANGGIIRNGTFVPARFRHAERQGEVVHFERWIRDAGFISLPLPDSPEYTFEGEGDALFYGDLLLAGYGPRSDAAAYALLGSILDCRIVPLHLQDNRWYHLDTCLIPLAPDLLAYYPGAFGTVSQTVLASLPGKKILMTEKDALNFGGNAVVCGQDIVLNAGSHELNDALRAHGYRVHETDLSEFIKAGGSAKCLVLMLDR
jgi:N-dimethylarginine dimethylaminohydrolase